MNKEKKLLIIGLILLVVGLGLKFANPDKNEENLAIMQQATNAQEAAQAIASNNQGEIAGNALAMFLMGLGGAMSVVAGIKVFTKKSA